MSEVYLLSETERGAAECFQHMADLYKSADRQKHLLRNYNTSTIQPSRKAYKHLTDTSTTNLIYIFLPKDSI
jgi:hypothetical protein